MPPVREPLRARVPSGCGRGRSRDGVSADSSVMATACAFTDAVAPLTVATTALPDGLDQARAVAAADVAALCTVSALGGPADPGQPCGGGGRDGSGGPAVRCSARSTRSSSLRPSDAAIAATTVNPGSVLCPCSIFARVCSET